MKQIQKGQPLTEYTSFTQHNNPCDWIKDVSTDLKLRCISHILEKEQTGLSGYTERPIRKYLEDGSNTLHIDHFRKRDLFPQPEYVFDWNNFIVDEHNDKYGADYKDNDKHNHIKAPEDYQKLLNPVSNNPHLFFTYNFDGEIVAIDTLSVSDKNKAEFTIKTFNLNHDSLKNQRRRLFLEVSSYVAELSNQEIKECLMEQGFPSFVDWALNTLRNMN